MKVVFLCLMLLPLVACVTEQQQQVSIADKELLDVKHQLPGDGRNCDMYWVESDVLKIVACKSWANEEVQTTLFECNKNKKLETWSCEVVQ